MGSNIGRGKRGTNICWLVRLLWNCAQFLFAVSFVKLLVLCAFFCTWEGDKLSVKGLCLQDYTMMD